jgi:hypothetical protein
MTKIEWNGRHQFKSLRDFLQFIKANHGVPHIHIVGSLGNCPIVIWLN